MKFSSLRDIGQILNTDKGNQSSYLIIQELRVLDELFILLLRIYINLEKLILRDKIDNELPK